MRDKKILIIDDDPAVIGLVRVIFAEAGAYVYTALNGQDGLRTCRRCRPDLVVLDIMMPAMDGWETLTLLRSFSNVPVILLTALGGESDIIHGLEVGAVDYITKPFSPRVLLARAEAAMRRTALASPAERPAIYDDGHLQVRIKERQVSVCGEPVRLTPTEHRLLVYLIENADRVCTHDQILEHVWGWEYQNSSNYVHVYIRYLRQKLERDPSHPVYLLTQRRVGYRFHKQAPRSRSR
jgi:two-component system KDP operon response regulator KdpE